MDWIYKNRAIKDIKDFPKGAIGVYIQDNKHYQRQILLWQNNLLEP